MNRHLKKGIVAVAVLLLCTQIPPSRQKEAERKRKVKEGKTEWHSCWISLMTLKTPKKELEADDGFRD